MTHNEIIEAVYRKGGEGALPEPFKSHMDEIARLNVEIRKLDRHRDFLYQELEKLLSAAQ